MTNAVGAGSHRAAPGVGDPGPTAADPAGAGTGPGALAGRALPAGLLVAIVLLAANLRPTLTGVGPLLPEIERSTGLSSGWAGLLSTLPLLTFAVTSPLVGRAASRAGENRLIALSLVVLVAGTAVRSVPAVGPLFAGTVLLSAAIACANVLLPAVVRRQVHPRRIGAVSSLYVTVMSVVASLASGVAVPLAEVLPGGWRASLAWSAVLALVALAVWVPRARAERAGEPAPVAGPTGAAAPARAGGAPWRSWLAWQVSLFMGLQSLAFYSLVAWLPTFLADRGMSAAAAGWMLFFYQLVGLFASSAVGLATRRGDDQRWLAAGCALLVTAGLVLLLALPGLALLACGVAGVGSGVLIVLALAFQSRRAATGEQAAALAGMAQGVGYGVAATGPLLLGVLHDAVGTWTVPLSVLVALSLVMAVAGYGAGRDTLIPLSRPGRR